MRAGMAVNVGAAGADPRAFLNSEPFAIASRKKCALRL